MKSLKCGKTQVFNRYYFYLLNLINLILQIVDFDDNNDDLLINYNFLKYTLKS